MATPEKAPNSENGTSPARPRFGARMKAWWHGADVLPAPSNDDVAPTTAKPEQDAPTESVASERTDDGQSGAVSFKLRFKAWWQGVDVAAIAPSSAPESPVEPPAASPAPPEPATADAPRRVWPSARIAAAERIWGAGFHTPGGLEFVIDLCKPFGLDKSKSALELGAGLGGHARAIATEFNTWVTGYEADPGLAEAAMAVSTQLGLAKRAAILPFNLASFLADPQRYNAAFSKEALYAFPGKAEILAALPGKLKDRGAVMITDFVLAAPNASGSALEAWRVAEPTPPDPWTWSKYEAAANAAAFEVRVHEDISDAYATMARAAWRNFETLLKPGTLDAETTEALFVEGELWHRRLGALTDGGLRVIRIHMIRR